MLGTSEMDLVSLFDILQELKRDISVHVLVESQDFTKLLLQTQ